MAFRHAIWAGLLIGVTTAASAQPSSTESVTVTGTKSRAVLQDYAHSFAARSQMIGKITRWETGICPITTGLPLEDAAFVTRRLKDVAARIGAPVSANAGCKHNIEIVFTRTPQALLDNVKKDQEEFLGYHDSPEQRDKLATVTHPIQAWYTTATQDLNGVSQVDVSTARRQGLGMLVQLPCAMLGTSPSGRPAGAICTTHLPYGNKYNVNGSRIRDGLRSDFYNIIVVADLGRIGSLQLDSVSDYVAMLALTQPVSLDACPVLSSIMSLLAKDCAGHADRLTDVDIGYLKAAYAMNPEMAVGLQERQIADAMAQSLPAAPNPSAP